MKVKQDIHAVRHFSVQVDYPELDSAQEMQNKVASILKTRLVDILEDSCNKFGTENFIRIEKLDIDLGDIPQEDIETALPRLFEKKIMQVFSGFKSDIFQREELEGVEVIDEKKLLRLYFIHYLKFGTMPWYVESPFRDLSFKEILAYLIEKNDPVFRQEFFSITKHPGARKRLLHFFETGETMYYLEKTLPGDLYNNIVIFKKEIETLISGTSQIDNFDKVYMRLYVKDFILYASGEAINQNLNYTFDRLVKEYVEFVSDIKEISPEKWIPAIFRTFGAEKAGSAYKGKILKNLHEYYSSYLLDQMSVQESVKNEFIKSSESFKEYLIELQPATGTYFVKLMENILKEVGKYLPIEKKQKLELLLRETLTKKLSGTVVKEEDVSASLYVVSESVKKQTGFPAREIAEEVIKEVQADKTTKHKKPEDARTERKEIDITIARDYWSLFLKAGIKPFYKLYPRPQEKLMDIFARYTFEKEEDARNVIQTIAAKELYMPAFWIRDIFGEDLFQHFRQMVKQAKGIEVSVDYDYEKLILVNFIRTGNFPWPEVAEKGYDRLLNIIEGFLLPDKRSELVEVIKQENFFMNKEVQKKVFGVMSFNFGKELLKIKEELPEELSGRTYEEMSGGKHPEKEAKGLSKYNLDQIASLIIDFNNKNLLSGYTVKEQADLIFDEIQKASRQNLFETAAMLVSLDEKEVNYVLRAMEKIKRDFITKMVRKYRAKFVSMAEEIKESEKKDEELHIKIETEAETGDSYFVSNAGLVLLNPYLKRLFKRLELTNNKEFVSDEAREKAVYVLQYIACGNDKPEEHEMILNKVMVGMPVTFPLKFDIELGEEEKEICNGLLESVIKNWTALKNTSVEGLQASFFLREGSLTKEAQGWRLRVEKRAFDVLLKKLPWGYSMVHMPWMEMPLYTDWEDQ
ncbi:MAG: contractile injection system tape measure protein [Bacteroidota bacterium]